MFIKTSVFNKKRNKCINKDRPKSRYTDLSLEKKLTNLIQGGNQFMRRQETPIVYQPAGMVYSFKTDLLYEIDTLFPFKDRPRVRLKPTRLHGYR